MPLLSVRTPCKSSEQRIKSTPEQRIACGKQILAGSVIVAPVISTHTYSACSRRMVSLVLIIVGTILFGVLVALYLFPYNYKGRKKTPFVSTGESKEHQQLFTLSEVSKHNTADDCWIIIKNKVYNVTPYVEEHPGGYAILNHAGGDSTEGFYGPQHASRVFDMVDEFYMGDLAS